MNYFGQYAYDIIDIVIAILALGVIIRGDINKTLIEIRNMINAIRSGVSYQKRSQYSNQDQSNSKSNNKANITINELYAISSDSKDNRSHLHNISEGLFSQTLVKWGFSFVLILCAIALISRSSKFLLILSVVIFVFPFILIYASKYMSKQWKLGAS